MSRLSQGVVYINSTREDWQNGKISNSNLTSLVLTDNLKKLRRWNKYGKEETFDEFLINQEELAQKKAKK